MTQNPQIRFKKDDGSDYPNWTEVPLSEVLTESKIKGNLGHIAKKLTVRLWGKGVQQSDSKQGSKNTNYFTRKYGQLIYGKQNIFRGAIGIIPKELDNYESTADLPAFDFFDNISKDFILQYLLRPAYYNQLEDKANGTGSKRIHVDTFLNLEVSLPCLEEQEKIAEYFTALDNKIANLDAQLSLMKDYKKGNLQQIFSQEMRFKKDNGSDYPDWTEVPLSEVADIVGGGTPDTKKAEYWGGEVLWLTPSEIGSQKYVSISQRTITELGLKNSSAKILPKGTILITTRATVGEFAILQNEATTNQGFQSLIVKESICTEYIYYLQHIIQKELYRRSSGSTFAEVNKSSMQSISVPLPCLEEQEKIAEYFTALDNKIANLDAQLSLMKDYKKGMLQRMLG